MEGPPDDLIDDIDNANKDLMMDDDLDDYMKNMNENQMEGDVYKDVFEGAQADGIPI